jgi:hypothetical protein
MKEKFIRTEKEWKRERPSPGKGLIIRENTEKGVLYYSNIECKEEMKRRNMGKGTDNCRRGGERKPGIVQEIGN